MFGSEARFQSFYLLEPWAAGKVAEIGVADFNHLAQFQPLTGLVDSLRGTGDQSHIGQKYASAKN